MEACCTCASLLSSIPPIYNGKTEKPARFERRLPCCARAICARCIADNPRFEAYCPYCQTADWSSVLQSGFHDPPAYEAVETAAKRDLDELSDEPPPYTGDGAGAGTADTKQAGPGEDVLHFVDPAMDSVQALSLRYGVPARELRRKNAVYSDHLLAARRTILIPGEYYQGPSLSSRPIEGEEEEVRKGKVRKWMVACKVPDYDIALLYLKQADYDLEIAVEAFKSDEAWEKEHPLQSSGKQRARESNGRRRSRLGGGLIGQLQ
ncbi:hypothetical protein EJ06DRAFT_534069 [Trichodelitschia bisporula]|uniref:LysM domain-containing protein n=1 Tax=Trichodelitschia bisporula TaxID=703511 RepID=A0A6G1HK27_9PEZI|nr:hypothetical protein EJ06DRAFT_534069 [Trichodelitschia bisporula]